MSDPQKDVDLLTFRPASYKDAQFIYDVKKKTLKSQVIQTWGDWDEKFQLKLHKQKFHPKYFKIILYQGKPIGVQKIIEKKSHIEVDILEILPEYQNHGFGTFILKKIIERAQSHKKGVKLQVLKVNSQAIRLYLKLGFITHTETTTHLQMQYL